MPGPDETRQASSTAVGDADVRAAEVSQGHLDLISELARAVTARRDLGDVLAATLAGLRRVLQFGGGSIQLLDEEGWIRMAAADPPASEAVLALRMPLGSTVGSRVILTERPVYVPDVHEEPVSPDDSRHLLPTGGRCYLGVPLLADGHAIGVLQIDSAVPDAWSELDRLLVISVAPVVAAAIQNARAHARITAGLARQRRADDTWNDVAALLDTANESLAALAGSSAHRPHDRGEISRLQQAVLGIRVLLDPAEDDAPVPSRATTPIDLRAGNPSPA